VRDKQFCEVLEAIYRLLDFATLRLEIDPAKYLEVSRDLAIIKSAIDGMGGAS
jgi:hypothetical protein